jgi:ribosomal protein S18 acetylase RimI-like enzyme
MDGAGPAVVVRAATVADVERMVELYAAVAEEGRWIGGEGPVDRDDVGRRWTERLAADDGVHLVADAAGLVVGQAGVDLAPYGVGYLGMLVDRQWRRRGVGTALVQAALDAARQRGCHKMSLQVWPHNEAARALYRKLGFQEEGLLRRHYPRRSGEIWDAVMMGRALDGGDRGPG